MTILKGFLQTAQFTISSDKKRIDRCFKYAGKCIFLLSYNGDVQAEVGVVRFSSYPRGNSRLASRYCFCDRPKHFK